MLHFNAYALTMNLNIGPFKYFGFQGILHTRIKNLFVAIGRISWTL